VSAALLALAACGRLRFDPSAGSGDAGSGDASSVDGSARTCSAWSTPQPMTAVNSASEDFDPELSPDGQWFVFASRRASPSDDLYLSQVTGGVYGAPQSLTALNSIAPVDNGPTWDPSGAILYFTAGRTLFSAPFAGGTFGAAAIVPELAMFTMDGPAISATGTELFYGLTTTSVAMFRTTRATQTSPWDPPAPVAELAGISAGWPTLSADGKTMYFEGQMGGLSQLFVVTRPAVGAPFGTPAVFAEIADPNHNEGDPFLSHDGQTFMFSSTRGAPATGTDLYVSTRTCQ
jgi:hypothetical protein